MNKKSMYFSIYNEEEIDKDLEIETIAENIEELSKFFRKPKRTLYDKGIKKTKDLRLYIEIDNKKYLVIVDED